MIVQHNITAMNSNRMLGLTTNSLAKSTEKLSSGYRINRAADDAAGLSISEKMRKQIRGLDQASTNAEDGISAVQTAEGALNEVHSMLQRMNELAVQSANGTNSESDRTAIQNEIDQLTTEIDRVSETTKFNETYLLKGDKSQDKQYTYSYKNFANAMVGTITDAEVGDFKLSFTGAADTDTTEKIQNEKNEFMAAVRDQGVKAEAFWDKSLQTPAVNYSLTLNGSAAEKFTVVQDSTTKTKFSIIDSDNKTIGSVTLNVTDAPAADTDPAKSATIIAKDNQLICNDLLSSTN